VFEKAGFYCSFKNKYEPAIKEIIENQNNALPLTKKV
jgi:hypothetical protein